MSERIVKPSTWARGDISRDHSKSSAYAHGYQDAWEEIKRQIREVYDGPGSFDERATEVFRFAHLDELHVYPGDREPSDPS